ncbi:ubiquitin-like small modifier protein 1 [Candidatus Amarolinea dominans]|uniref:ubiquitin-like small modifier protein 1 n=1 Tax=Candidatus Amarolinea dominans TaxID=3140696 RepID=UPI001D603CE8|nr:MoaD family protein [Anaerolineae bacterium]
MKVHFSPPLRPMAGSKTVDFDLPEGATIRSLVDAIVTRFPAMRPELLDADGNLYLHVHVFVNGRDTHFLPLGMDTPLSLSDVLNVFPAVGGGAW